ncbi:MAG: peptidase MA family metallohydrolase [Dehalococcoidia bacterium]|nr:peptidase MA family metallohydrolase [Dehalococcoidia bacterium]
MIKRIALVAWAVLWLLSPSLVVAESGITVTASDVDVDFPSRAVFTVEAESYVDVVDVRLCYRVDRMNYAEVVSEGWADFTPANRIEANWVWDMTNASLPPGAEVTYWWVIEDDDGNRVETSPKTMHFDDSRFSWHNLTGTVYEGGGMTLFWYAGGDSFARALLDACEAGLAKLSQEIGAYPEKPIKIYVYASTTDLRGAMVFSQEWTGGVAFMDFGIIAIGIPSSELEWGRKALVHELTHLVVRQATFGPYGQLPLWLDEGLATYNEGELDPALRSSLDKAILEGTLISVRSLCSPFSAYPEKARLSYAESHSLVEYLLDSYGQDKMLDVLTSLKLGNTYDEALTAAYGFDIDGLDARWRATLTREERQFHPALIAALAALATGLAIWGALTLKKRTKRRSSGTLIVQDKP